MPENIKDALEYAVDLYSGQKVVVEAKGKTWVDKTKGNLTELDGAKYAETLSVRTLTGLVGYLKEKFEEKVSYLESKDPEPLLVHVDSPTKVCVYSQLNADRKRESIIQAVATLDHYPYGKFLDSERFIINILSLFERNEGSESVRQCASAIRIEGGADLTDNGVSQIATVKEGAATYKKGEVPSPVELRPYRTFLEVEQPQSPFVFRIDRDGDCALFEADGGMWRHLAMDNIAKFLHESLASEIDEGYITIIA